MKTEDNGRRNVNQTSAGFTSTLARTGQPIFYLGGVVLILLILVGCASCTWNLDLVDYAPLHAADWEVSTPGEQGLDPMLVAELYFTAAKLETLYGLLVVKNGMLIAEGYFNDGALDQSTGLASATKSYISALVGIALDQGYLTSVDQTMVEFFPEFTDQISDPRKEQITIRQLLQMRSGYPWEERESPYMEMIFATDNFLPYIVEFPLTTNPGTEFGYSNLASHLLGVVVTRASGVDLKSFGQAELFSRIDAQVGDWWQDASGYHWGAGLMSSTARDAAKLGLLYLNDGLYEGTQVVSATWVKESLQRYSEGINFTGWIPGMSSKLGRYFSDIGYGYQWWSARVGDHHFNYAAGHGGNLIVLLEDLDMIVVTTANDLHGIFGQEAWKHEGAIIDMVGRFIGSLPTEQGS
jgi:CubicO group peptidase (beta-lactamase class C family)